MCGRLNFRPNQQLRLELEQLGLNLPENMAKKPPRWNIAPTEAIQVLCDIDGRRVWPPMRWWLHPHWSREEPNQKFAMFNARAENLATSRAFKGPLQYRRGIILADAFIEWRRSPEEKVPYLFQNPEGAPLLLAAVWDEWREEFLSCAVITQAADAAFSHYHGRMPLLLNTEQAQRWLDLRENPRALLNDLLGQRPSLQALAVNPAINNARNKAAASPVSAPQPL